MFSPLVTVRRVLYLQQSAKPRTSSKKSAAESRGECTRVRLAFPRDLIILHRADFRYKLR